MENRWAEFRKICYNKARSQPIRGLAGGRQPKRALKRDLQELAGEPIADDDVEKFGREAASAAEHGRGCDEDLALQRGAVVGDALDGSEARHGLGRVLQQDARGAGDRVPHPEHFVRLVACPCQVRGFGGV